MHLKRYKPAVEKIPGNASLSWKRKGRVFLRGGGLGQVTRVMWQTSEVFVVHKDTPTLGLAIRPQWPSVAGEHSDISECHAGCLTLMTSQCHFNLLFTSRICFLIITWKDQPIALCHRCSQSLLNHYSPFNANSATRAFSQERSLCSWRDRTAKKRKCLA